MSGSAIETIAPNASATIAFTVGKAGTYFYLDPKFSPVNRVLGLHGALIVEPKTAMPTQRREDACMPAHATPAIKALFGASAEVHGSPAAVGYPVSISGYSTRSTPRCAAGSPPARTFRHRNSRSSSIPRYFTINGLCGLDSCA